MAGLSGVIAHDLASIVGKSAPLLASVLGSPLAGVGVSLIANLFGAKDSDELLAKINSDPEASLKLKTLEYDHADALVKIASQDFATAAQDKQDARRYSDFYHDFLRHMAYFVTAGFFIVLILIFLPIDFTPTEKNLLSILVGMLASKWQTIIDFFYGSSSKQGAFK